MSSPVLRIEALGFPWATLDPFLFCAYHLDTYPEGQPHLGPAPEALQGRNIGSDFAERDGWRMYHGSTVPGFPYHPHRGFETVTIAQQGLVDHADSLGAAGRFGNGDVQWMTAGKGVQHAEMFPLLNQDGPNPLELFQIWLNLPKKDKAVPAHFRMLWRENIPTIRANGSSVDVIAGRYGDTTAADPAPNSWAANPANEVMILTIHLEPGATLELPAAAGAVNRVLYYYRGTGLSVTGESVPSYHSVTLDGGSVATLQNGSEDAYLLLLQGRPIAEPVAQYGPFVMNTPEEIQEAFADYRATEFGGWPWDRPDQTHGPTRGRFALHADGREEVPG